MGPLLSVVIPAFNEEARIGPTIERILSYLKARGGDFEVVVVDDGSRDATRERAAEALADFPQGRLLDSRVNRGKGHAVRKGMLAAAGKFILFTDADLSTPIEEVDKFWPLLGAGNDIVIGSRALPDSDVRVRQNWIRQLMGKTFNLFVRVLVMDGLPDTQCGFKLFRRPAARAVFERLETRGFSFDVEALDLARRLGFRIAQVPVVWRNSPPSRVHLVASSARMLMELWAIRRRREKISGRRDG